jgi:hypothetical protein
MPVHVHACLPVVLPVCFKAGSPLPLSSFCVYCIAICAFCVLVSIIAVEDRGSLALSPGVHPCLGLFLVCSRLSCSHITVPASSIDIEHRPASDRMVGVGIGSYLRRWLCVRARRSMTLHISC